MAEVLQGSIFCANVALLLRICYACNFSFNLCSNEIPKADASNRVAAFNFKTNIAIPCILIELEIS